MFGKNPKLPLETGDGNTLQIVEIFATLQGEGPFSGQPAVFVRLGGCNLACTFCDTEFDAFMEMALYRILDKIVNSALGRAPDHVVSPLSGYGAPVAPLIPSYLRDLVVITGGEPLRQNIAPLCEALLARGLRVQIETNGTLWRQLPEAVHIVCSPKMTDGRYNALRPDLLARVDALKFIVAADDADYHAVGEVGQSSAGRVIPIYVQPMDVCDPVRNEVNTNHALHLAQLHGYRLSLQLHKLLGIA